jgi:hypothetical protein
MCVCEPPQAGRRCRGLTCGGGGGAEQPLQRRLSRSTRRLVLLLAETPLMASISSRQVTRAPYHLLAKPCVASGHWPLAGVECVAGPHERFPRVRIVLASGTEGAQPRKHAHGCLCLHIIAARHRASGRPGASGADDGKSRRQDPGEWAAVPAAVGQHTHGQRVAALGRSGEPHRGLGCCLLASAAQATGRLGREDVLEAQRALGVDVARAGRVHALGQKPPPGLGVLVGVPVEIVPLGSMGGGGTEATALSPCCRGRSGNHVEARDSS